MYFECWGPALLNNKKITTSIGKALKNGDKITVSFAYII